MSKESLTSTQRSAYTASVKRISTEVIQTSDITAQTVVADGFTLSQTDHAGITVTASRSYTATGMTMTQTDGRGNATTTVMDKAGRPTSVTDAAGNTTSTAYDANHDQPAVVTDAQGHTACYQYDNRGRKAAKWGTGIQIPLQAAGRVAAYEQLRSGIRSYGVYRKQYENDFKAVM